MKLINSIELNEKQQLVIDKAFEVAQKAHKNQVDIGGEPYIFHPITICNNCDTFETKVVALLHDVIEDSDVTESDLLQLGFDKEIVDAVVAITKVKNTEYFDYLVNIKNNEIARRVKVEDLKHNSDLSRLKKVKNGDLKRLGKYQQALRYLDEANIKEIKIEIEDGLCGLASEDLGKRLYKQYLESNIDFSKNEKYIIIFPDFVKDISVLFVKEFTEEIFKTISKYDFYKYFVVIGSNTAMSDFKDGIEW